MKTESKNIKSEKTLKENESSRVTSQPAPAQKTDNAIKPHKAGI